MHCASLGEFEQGRPLLEEIRRTEPGVTIILTFFSSSGYEIRKDYKGADYIFYLPMDSASNARRLLDLFQPKLVLWVKYEFWYYVLREIHRREIPLLLVSGIFRDDQPFFKWYGGIYREMLNFFTHFFVQNEQSKELLAGAGYKDNCTISGDTRFDRVVEIAEGGEHLEWIERFCAERKTVVAGSTWQEDEEELDHYANTHPDIRFILAPHEIDKSHLQDIRKLFHRNVLYSELVASATLPQPDVNVLIIDNIGMLSRLYKYATITYVGGGFGEDGVHNVLEAAVYGKPVVFGPVYDKFIEAEELVENGGAFSIESALELEAKFDMLFNDEKAYNDACEASKVYVYAKTGAKKKIMEYIALLRVNASENR
jgi:3-deoxy-D-manno-octulosonic-acid transferase